MKAARFLLVIFLMVNLLFTYGCAVVSHGRLDRINPHQVDTIKVGISTKDDIIKQFGKPQQVVYKPNIVEVFIYSHGVEKNIMIPFFVLSWGRSGGTSQRFTITFQNGVVADYEYTTDERGMIEYK